MPIALSKLLRRDVFAVADGLRLGRPHDFLIDQDTHKVSLVVLSMTGVPQTATIVGADKVRAWDEDTIAIDRVDSTRLAHEVPEASDMVKRNLQFRGRDVFSTNGHKLGRIVDAVIDEQGSVTQYLVASNTVKRVLRMTDSVMPSDIRTAGGDAAVVAEQRTDSAQAKAGTISSSNSTPDH